MDEALSKRRRKAPARAQAALIAVDPRTGEILALVGGRSYNQSQFNRATTSRRQPGSVFKPFVYLAAFEHAARTGEPDLTAASLTLDEPATFDFNGEIWEPRNYDDYDGEITWRRALAMSRNLGTIRVGERIGFDTIAQLWRQVGVGEPPRGFPSITLGVFELTPLEVAQAYTLFTNGGHVRPLRAIARIQADSKPIAPKDAELVAGGQPAVGVPRHEHDAERAERGHRRRRARPRLHARRRRQDRHHQRPARRLVRRLHARAADGRLGGLRRQPAAGPERRPRGACPSGPTS